MGQSDGVYWFAWIPEGAQLAPRTTRRAGNDGMGRRTQRAKEFTIAACSASPTSPSSAAPSKDDDTPAVDPPAAAAALIDLLASWLKSPATRRPASRASMAARARVNNAKVPKARTPEYLVSTNIHIARRANSWFETLSYKHRYTRHRYNKLPHSPSARVAQPRIGRWLCPGTDAGGPRVPRARQVRSRAADAGAGQRCCWYSREEQSVVDAGRVRRPARGGRCSAQ